MVNPMENKYVLVNSQVTTGKHYQLTNSSPMVAAELQQPNNQSNNVRKETYNANFLMANMSVVFEDSFFCLHTPYLYNAFSALFFLLTAK